MEQEQKRYKWSKEQIKDFLDPTGSTRMIGRSNLARECYMEIASEHPNTKIFVQDHLASSKEQLDEFMRHLHNRLHEANIRLKKMHVPYMYVASGRRDVKRYIIYKSIKLEKSKSAEVISLKNAHVIATVSKSPNITFRPDQKPNKQSFVA